MVADLSVYKVHRERSEQTWRSTWASAPIVPDRLFVYTFDNKTSSPSQRRSTNQRHSETHLRQMKKQPIP